MENKIFLLSVKSIDLELSFGTDYTDYTVFFVVIEMQASEFLLRTILRRLMGKHFSFYLDALSEIDQ